MRILSQQDLYSGMIDVPYEQVSVEQREDEVWCGYYATLGKHCIGKCFAKYSTIEKAQKAIKMMHDAYLAHENFKGLDSEVQIDIWTKARPENAIKYGGIFQFPQDNEVED